MNCTRYFILRRNLNDSEIHQSWHTMIISHLDKADVTSFHYENRGDEVFPKNNILQNDRDRYLA